MRVSILAAAALAAALAVSPQADAQAPVNLPEEAMETLADGGRVNVIVMLEEPAVAAEVAAMSEQALADRAAGIRSRQEQVVARGLGVALAELERTRDSFQVAIAEDRAEGEPVPASPALQRAFRYTPALAMRLDAAQIETLAATPGVARIVENGINYVGMDQSLVQIGANLVHDEGFGGSGQAVAILDTGTDHDHPMTGPALIGSACFSTSIPEENFWSQCPNGQAVAVGGRSGDPCTDCRFPSNHGTHVGGTVAGRPYTVEIDGAQRTLMGVAPEAYLVGVNVFGDSVDAGRAGASDGDILAGLEWIIDNPTFPDPEGGDPIPVSAINMSLGGGAYTDFCDANVLAPAVVMLRSMGIATAIASGNNGYNSSVGHPSCIGAAVTVGAVDRSDAVASFSNSNFVVDLLAPGVGIRSAQMDEGSGIGAVAYNGTSMATPHVAGAFALLRSAFPAATVDQIEYALKATGRPVTDPDNNITRPRIQVNLAFEYLARQFEEQGPFAIAPTTDYFATIDLNRPEQPDVVTYMLTNNGNAPVDYAVRVENNDAITFGGGVREFESTLAAGASYGLNIEIDLAAVRLGRTTGEIIITAETGGRPQVLRIRASVAGYQGPAPTLRPANDNFADAFPLIDGQTEVTVSTFGATTQIAEPDHAGGDNGGSVWYALQARRTGRISLALQGRQGTNALAVYSGSSIAALAEVASTSAQDDNAVLTFDAVEGQSYRIAIDYNPPANTFGGQERETVAFVISPQTGSYDAFATPFELTAPAGQMLLSFGGSTVEDGEPFPPTADSQGTLWMHVTGHAGEQLTLSVVQVSDGVSLEVFTGSSLATLEQVEGFTYTSFNFGERKTVTIPEGGLYIRAIPLSLRGGAPNRSEMLFNWQIGAEPATARVSTSVAPQVRTARPHQFVTALVAAAAAASGADAQECGIVTPVGYPGVFAFTPLTPESGDSGDGADIPAGQAQIFAFGAQRSSLDNQPAAFVGLSSTPVTVTCTNGAAAAQTSLNTLYLTLADEPLPDVIVSTAIAGGNIVTLAPDGVTRFAAAAANLGTVPGDVIVVPVSMDVEYSGALITAASDALFNIGFGGSPSQTLPLDISVCETDPADGRCYSSFSPYLRIEDFGAGATRTFAIRVAGQGEEVTLAPVRNRIALVFIQTEWVEGVPNPQTARLVGAATVAVRTASQD